MKKTLVFLASAIFAIMMFVSCSSEPKPLTEGQWEFKFFGETSSYYQFNADGTGKYTSFILDEKYDSDFTYTIDGDKMTIQKSGLWDEPETYTYKIDGDEMTMEGGLFDSKMTYEWNPERK